MKRDHDLDALAEALERAQQRSWLAQLADRALAAVGRLVRRALARAAGPAAASVGLAVLLHLAHIDPGWLLMAMFYGSPFLAVAAVSFVVHTWRQNSTTPVYGAGQEVGQAEPGQVANEVGQPAPVGPVGQDVGVGQPATPVRPVTVTATVVDLPAPAGELPAAPTAPAPAWGTPDYAHEPDETKEEIA